ncbi:MAG: 4Fe-4S dicluster domain-containing protein [Desulfatiglandales bacterium]
MRFNEELGQDNKPVWYFFPDQCRHCLEPPCKEMADAQIKGGIVIDEATGAVIYTEKLKGAKAKEIMDACPFNIPRVDQKTGLMAKCTMCVDRVKGGMLPACVKSCATGAMNFGDREKMVEMAKKRLEEVKAKYPKAQFTGL